VARNLIIIGLVLLALGIAAATQSATIFGLNGLMIAGFGAYLVTFGNWQISLDSCGGQKQSLALNVKRDVELSDHGLLPGPMLNQVQLDPTGL
jgi:hypothetical protein